MGHRQDNSKAASVCWAPWRAGTHFGSFLVVTDGNRSRVGACPPPRKVAAKELAIADSLKSATLWGGVGGGETRRTALFFSDP